MTLFVAPKDPQVALWAGECSGVEGAVSLFGADEVSPSPFSPRLRLFTWRLRYTNQVGTPTYSLLILSPHIPPRPAHLRLPSPFPLPFARLSAIPTAASA